MPHPQYRRSRRATRSAARSAPLRLGLGAGFALLPALVALGWAAPSGATSPPPTAELYQSVEAATTAGSVHMDVTQDNGTKTSVESLSAGPDGGTYTSSQSGETLQVELVGKTLFLRGDAHTLSALMGLATSVAHKYSDRWISSPTSANGVGQLAQVLSVKTIVGSLIDLTAPLTATAGHTPGGQPVVTITGKLPKTKINQGSGAGTRVTLTVQAAAPHLPLALSFKVKGQGTFTFAFSNWGRAVHVTAPTSSVPMQKVIRG